MILGIQQDKFMVNADLKISMQIEVHKQADMLELSTAGGEIDLE
jgi:hypothetical protein